MSTIQQRTRALYDIWVFADLIGFKGGREYFADFHFEYTDFITAPNEQGLDAAQYAALCRRLCMMPRGHLKSTLGSVLYILWRIYRNPDIRILYGTPSQKLGRSFIRELRQYFEDPELQKDVWNNRPHIPGALVPALDAATRRAKNQKRGNSRFVVDDDEVDGDNMASDKKLLWSREAIQVIRPGKFKEPTVWVVSTGTMTTGDHADLLIGDDVVTFKNSDTPEKRESIFEWTLDLASVVDPPRFIKHGKFSEWVGAEWLYLGTRYYGGDLYETYLERAEKLKLNTFIRNVYKNGVNGEDGYLWGEKFTPEYVADLRAQTEMDKGQNRWASQYLNQVITEEDKLVKEDSIQYVHASSMEALGDGLVRIKVGEERVVIKLEVVVDPAASVSKRSDFSVVAVGGYDDQKRLFVVDLKAGKWDGVQLIDHIFDMCEKWKTRRVHVEAVAYQKQLLTFIRDRFTKRFPLALLEYVPRGNKHQRITAQLEPLLLSRMIYFANWIAQVAEFKDEINYFPKSAHDDVLDAVAILAEVSMKTSQKRKPRGSTSPSRTERRYNALFGGVR